MSQKPGKLTSTFFKAEIESVIKSSLDENYQALPLKIKTQDEKLSSLDENMRELHNKVNTLSTSNINPMASPQNLDTHLNTITTELADRAMRANNALLFNLCEPPINNETDAPQCEQIDHQAALQLLSTIHNISDNRFKVKRLGRAAEGETRPLLVSLSSSADALAIVKKKKLPHGPSYIKPDLTFIQRQQLEDLRKANTEYVEKGIRKTIKYINNTPTLVNDQEPVPNGHTGSAPSTGQPMGMNQPESSEFDNQQSCPTQISPSLSSTHKNNKRKRNTKGNSDQTSKRANTFQKSS